MSYSYSNPAFASLGASEEQQEDRAGGQWESRCGECSVHCAFIPAVPRTLRPGCPQSSVGISESHQAVLWEPIH